MSRHAIDPLVEAAEPVPGEVLATILAHAVRVRLIRRGWTRPQNAKGLRVVGELLAMELEMIRVSLLLAAAIFVRTALAASASLLAPSSWIGSALTSIGLGAEPGTHEVVFSASGGMFVSGTQACATPTQTLGSQSPFMSCVSEYNASGASIFATQIGGAYVDSIALDSSGNVYVAGGTAVNGAGFAPTPGAYEQTMPAGSNSFLCKLSGIDGHAFYCTYVDVGLLSEGNIAIDSAGNAYLAGLGCNSLTSGCVEQINADGTGIGYETAMTSGCSAGALLTLDASNDLYCLNSGLTELSASGAILATANLGSEAGAALAMDAAGNPVVVIEDISSGAYRVRKYSPGFATVLFDTTFNAGGNSAIGSMVIDSSGVVDIVGGASAVTFTQVNPTQACAVPSPVVPGWNAFLVRVDASGNLLQATNLGNFFQDFYGTLQSAVLLTGSGATVALWSAGSGAISIMTLSPASSIVSLGCIGNAASFEPMALAPNEIVSVFGSGLGPAAGVSAQPGANGLYPDQLGGVQITFDGIAAPLIYANSGQVNLVTPGALNGKSSTNVCAVINNTPSNCATFPVQPGAPGIFLASDSSTIPYAAAVNQDGTINSQSNPAAAGSVISMYVTGLGVTSPTITDGSVTPVMPPAQNLEVGVYACQNPCQQPEPEPVSVLYAGPAPLEIEGLGQINFAVPALGFTTIDISVSSSSAERGLFSDPVTIWSK